MEIRGSRLPPRGAERTKNPREGALEPMKAIPHVRRVPAGRGRPGGPGARFRRLGPQECYESRGTHELGRDMQVTNLFVKRHHGGAMDFVATLGHGTHGIRGNVACAPLRQVLIASRSVMTECGLHPGDLRENIVVDFDRLYDLPSGTVVRIGEAMIRLTFHCEPCKTISEIGRVRSDRAQARRTRRRNSGSILIGHEFAVTDICLEPIPYAVHERI